MVSGKGIVVDIKTRFDIDKDALIKGLNDVMSGLDFTKAFLSQDFSSMDSYLKRNAYDREMAKSGDEDLAKKAADAAGFSESQKETMGLLKDLSGVMKDFGNSIVGFVQGMFGVVEEIYKHMKKSSPLLEMIENLFNLAMQLFFMPLGNKLAEVMLPAIINMLDAVMDIWDKFEGKTLGEMFSIAITEGVQLVASYLMDLGSLLENEEGIVRSIGSLLSTIGEFLADDGARIIEFLARVFEFLMNNVGYLILMAVEFFAASIGIQSGIFAYLMARMDWKEIGSKIAAASAVTAGVGAFAAVNAAFIGSGMAGEVFNIQEYANGGYVPPSPGGKVIRIAEGGEGEYIIPESKVDTMLPGMIPYNSSVSNVSTNVSTANMGSNVTNNFYFEGLTNDELKTIIRDEVNDMVSQSKYRGGY